MNAIEKLISIATAEVGYLEKKSNAYLDDKTANTGTANYTKYWRDINPSYQRQPWCAAFVTWCFEKAFGRDKAAMLLRHYPYVYCPTMASLFALNANPKKGDIVIFYRNGAFAHTGIVTGVNGDYFTTIEGNTSGGSTIIANGGGVCQKEYYNSKLPGTKFCTPDWNIVESEDNPMTTEERAKFNELVKAVSDLTAKVDELTKPEMIWNYIDKNIPDWALDAVRWANLSGIIKGNEKNELQLNGVKLWMLVVLYRAAKWICKQVNVKI